MSEWQWQWWKEELAPALNHTKRADDFRVLQGIWDLIRIGNEDYLRSPLFPVVVSVIFYFSCMVPFTIFDLWGQNWNWIHKYKIQPEKNVTWPACRNAIMVILWNHCVYILPASIGQAIWTPPTPLPPLAPTLTEFLLEQVVMLLIFDFQYFVWHYTHHRIKFLYKHIHSIHHQYYSPFCWVTQYLSPLELITVGTYTTVLPWVFNCHVFTTWTFMIINIIISVEAHIGYDFPFALHNWDPTGIIGGAPKHDMHHMKPQTNFAPFFNHFDKALGTYWPGLQAGGVKNKKYIEFENKKKMEKGKKK